MKDEKYVSSRRVNASRESLLFSYVPDQHTDGRPQGCHTIRRHPTQYLGRVGLATGRGDPRLTGPTPVELELDFLQGDVESGRHAVDNAATAATVRLSKGRNSEHMPVR